MIKNRILERLKTLKDNELTDHFPNTFIEEILNEIINSYNLIYKQNNETFEKFIKSYQKEISRFQKSLNLFLRQNEDSINEENANKIAIVLNILTPFVDS